MTVHNINEAKILSSICNYLDFDGRKLSSQYGSYPLGHAVIRDKNGRKLRDPIMSKQSYIDFIRNVLKDPTAEAYLSAPHESRSLKVTISVTTLTLLTIFLTFPDNFCHLDIQDAYTYDMCVTRKQETE